MNSHVSHYQFSSMAEGTEPPSETSALLRSEEEINESENAKVITAISTKTLTRNRLIVAIGFTWLSSFLAALGTQISMNTRV